MNMKQRKGMKGGYSLVEVMMSLLIIAVMLTTLLPLIVRSVRDSYTTGEMIKEVSTAQQVMEEKIFELPSNNYLIHIEIGGDLVEIRGEKHIENYWNNHELIAFSASLGGD